MTSRVDGVRGESDGRGREPNSALVLLLLTGACMDYQLVAIDGAEPELVGPRLQITPASFDFGTTLRGCAEDLDLLLTNVGGAALSITDFDYDSSGLLRFDARGLDLPIELAPGESVEVGVAFEAVELGWDQGLLTVTSNDPRGWTTAVQEASSIDPAAISEVFTTDGVGVVDVLWAIDQSRSMEEDNRDDIRAGVPGFLAALSEGADFHLIQVTRDTGCANDGVLTNDSENAASLLVDHAFGAPRAQQSTTEKLLEQVDTALRMTGPGACNDGFLRPGAPLHVIVASDEEDQSAGALDDRLESYASYVADPDLLTVSAIVDVGYRCGDGTGPGAYLLAAEATGGAVLDICSPAWGSELEQVATRAVQGQRSYDLEHEADPSSLVVSVDGVPTQDFRYVEAANTVILEVPELDGGEEVVITYDALGTCV